MNALIGGVDWDAISDDAGLDATAEREGASVCDLDRN